MINLIITQMIDSLDYSIGNLIHFITASVALLRYYERMYVSKLQSAEILSASFLVVVLLHTAAHYGSYPFGYFFPCFCLSFLYA